MKPVHILLVEDNEGDILLTTEAFENAKLTTHLSFVKDGKEAIDFVTKNGKFKNVAMPDMLLLDMNLPKKNGIEVLQFIKGDPDLRHIPVIMLTTSSLESDISKAYKHYANCYITKPTEVEYYQDVIAKIENFWLSTVTLPANRTPHE